MRNINNKVDNSNTPLGQLPAVEWNDTITEIINVITDTNGGNTTLNASVNTQLLTSIQRIALLALNSISLKSEISQPLPMSSGVPQIDTLNTSGFYSIPVGGVNGVGGSFPAGWDFTRASSFILHICGVTTNLNGVQIIGQRVGTNDTKLWVRAESTTNNSWDNWDLLISSTNIQSLGLSTTALASAVADVNASFVSSLYRANNSTANTPFSGSWVGIRLAGSASTDWLDILVNLTIENSFYFRRKTASGFGSWFQLATQTDLDAVRPFVGKVEMTSGNVLPSGYLWADGSAVSRTTYASLFNLYVTSQGFTPQIFSINIANPTVFTTVAPHGFVGGERLRLSTTGSLPTGVTSTEDYFVEVLSATTFNLYSLVSSNLVSTTGGQSGVHSYIRSLYGLGDGSTTFNLPDYRGLSLLGASTPSNVGSFTKGNIPLTGWGSLGSGSASAGRLLSGTGAGEAGEFLESIGSVSQIPRAGITPRGFSVNYIIKF